MSNKLFKEKTEAELKTHTNVKTVCVILAVLAVVAALIAIIHIKNENKAEAEPETKRNTEVKTYYADIDIKDYGVITVKLDGASAPATVENFVNLARSGFYDGLSFHRIIEGFMMQGGAGKDSSASQKTVVGEFSANGYENNISHVRGTISMARASSYNSASTQFFIVHKDSTYLDGKYAGFGEVISGIEVVDKICTDAKPTDNNGTIEESKQPVINSIRIRE